MANEGLPPPVPFRGRDRPLRPLSSYCRYAPEVPFRLLHFFGHSAPMLFRRLIKHAHITPVADSMKLHRLVGADSQVGSLPLSVKGSVAMRRAVVRQMNKPRLKRMTRPTREPVDIFRRKMMGMGRMKMARSVRRFRMAFVQLRRRSVIHLFECSKCYLPRPKLRRARSWYRTIVHSWDWAALEDGHKDVRDGPAD
jgi:hypothetical protein